MNEPGKEPSDLIGELRAARERLAELEALVRGPDQAAERLRLCGAALQNAQVSVFAQDRQLRYTWIFNPHPSLSSEAIVGKTDEDLLSAAEAAALVALKRRVLETGKGERDVFRFTLNAEASFHDIVVEPLRDAAGGIAGVSGSATDITARIAEERELKEKSQQARVFMDALPCVALLLRPVTREIVALNRTARDAGAVAGETCFGSWLKEDKACSFCRAPDLWQSNQPQQVEVDVQGVVWDAHWVPVSEDLYLHYAFDVTDRKRAERALQESEARLRATIESLPCDFFTLDTEGRYTMQNSRCQAQWGDLVGKTPADVAPDEQTAARWMDNNRRVLAGELVAHEMGFPVGGETRWHQQIISPIRVGDDISGIVGLNFDITERKRTEESLATMQKLESLGVMAGGIAHDFNNILTRILGNLCLAEGELDPDSEAFELVGEALTACDAAKSLAQQLLTFARGGHPIARTMSLPDILEQAAIFAARGSNAKCVFAISEDLLCATVDRDQLSQVIQNLILNAIQAMPDGGVITIGADNVHLGDGDVPPLAAGEFVKITVTDEGPGIPDADRARVFDPYFSTKGEGRGLGLATCHSIIVKHGGQMTVESGSGTGARLSIYLPACLSPDDSQEDVSGDVRAGRGRVLMMDDEPMVIRVLSRMLARLGYEATAASDGAQALQLYRQAMESGRPFDAVIMDLTVPGGMGGEEAIRRLREIDPQAQAIVSSGYSNDPIMADYARAGFAGVLAKPYVIEQVSAVLGRIVHRPVDR